MYRWLGLNRSLIQLEMCPGNTDIPAVAKLAYSHKKSKITHFDGQRAIIFEAMGDMNHFGT